LTCITRPNFPSTCLSPDQPGFGQVIPSGQVRRRSRKSAQNSIMQVSPSPSTWNVITTNSGHAEKPQWPIRSAEYSYPGSNHPLPRDFGPSPVGPPPSAYRRPLPSTKVGLSVDTRSLYPEMSSPYHEQVRLPPIQSPAHMSPRSPYALPPISALEDLRGTVTQDSAAVLRRLRMEDDDYPSRSTSEIPRQPWDRRSYVPPSP
jgi:hypothetical protein